MLLTGSELDEHRKALDAALSARADALWHVADVARKIGCGATLPSDLQRELNAALNILDGSNFYFESGE